MRVMSVAGFGISTIEPSLTSYYYRLGLVMSLFLMKSEFTCKNLFVIIDFFSAVCVRNVYPPPDQSDIRVITLH